MNKKLGALAALIDQFGREHWDEGFDASSATLAIDGETLSCVVDGERIEGHPAAPLLFASGAWGLILAHKQSGSYAHRVNGKINRVFPLGDKWQRDRWAMHGVVRDWAKLWPEVLFSSSLYEGVDTPGRPRRPRSEEDAPGRTTLTGILKRILKTADDPDPLERLKVVEFVLFALKDWLMTGEDLMMDAVEKPLLALARDQEPAVCELAILALELCAARCWIERAYGRYEAVCRLLAEMGFNAHLQYARLAESAYAAGDIPEGDRLLEIGREGGVPRGGLLLSRRGIGDWDEMQFRVLRQAGGANNAWSHGQDPNRYRQMKIEKSKKTKTLNAKTKAHHIALARQLLSRAAKGVDERLQSEISAAKAGKKLPLGPGEVDPRERDLYHSEIFYLQSFIAEWDGDKSEQLRLLFKAIGGDWQDRGYGQGWRNYAEEKAVELALGRETEDLAQLGMPESVEARLAEHLREAALAKSDAGREQLFWQNFFTMVRDVFHKDAHFHPYPGEEMAAEFKVTREGGMMRIGHPDMAGHIEGPLSTPLLNVLRAWHAGLRAKHGIDAPIEINSWKIATFGADGVDILADMAADALSAGAQAEAIALYRFAHRTDPLLQPWPYRDPVAPLALETVPEHLRAAVSRTSRFESDEGFAKVKPRGRRVEQIAAELDLNDAVDARYIAHILRDICGGAGESEIARVWKSGTPLIIDLWNKGDPQVREALILVVFKLFINRRIYMPATEAPELEAIFAEGAITAS